MATLPAMPLRLTDSNGLVLAGAKLTVYLAGTNTITDSYSDALFTTPHASPVVADIGGLFPSIYLKPGSYKFRYANAAGAAIAPDVDNYLVEESTSSLNPSVQVKTSNFTVSELDRNSVFLVDASGALGLNINISADSATLGSSFQFTVVNYGVTGTFTVQGIGGQTVEGQPSQTVSSQYSSSGYVSIGAGGWATDGKTVAFATPTDVITGTDGSKTVTPLSLAALSKKGSDIASAATIVVGEGGFFNVTGFNSISSIDVGASGVGREFDLYFTSPLKLIHGAGFVLPNSQNINAVAGDVARCRLTASGVVTVFSFSYNNSLFNRVLSKATISAASNAVVNLEQFTGYENFKVILSNVRPTNDAVGFYMRFSSDGGLTYISSASAYSHSGLYETSGVFANIGNSVSFIDLSGTTIGNQANEFAVFDIDIFNAPSVSKNTAFLWTQGGVMSTPHPFGGVNGGLRNADEKTTHLQLYMSAGNISSMDVVVIGVS